LLCEFRVCAGAGRGGGESLEGEFVLFFGGVVVLDLGCGLGRGDGFGSFGPWDDDDDVLTIF
jgi:hypothetical protein